MLPHLAFLLLFSLACWGDGWVPGRADVRELYGRAEVRVNPGNWKSIAPLDSFRSGTFSIRTDTNSEVELFLGENGPVIRISAETEFHADLKKSSKHFSTTFTLRRGKIRGYNQKLPLGSLYKIHGTEMEYNCLGGEFEVCANGNLWQLSGEGTLTIGTNTWLVPANHFFLKINFKVIPFEEGTNFLRKAEPRRMERVHAYRIYHPGPDIVVPKSAGPFATGLAYAQTARGHLLPRPPQYIRANYRDLRVADSPYKLCD